MRKGLKEGMMRGYYLGTALVAGALAAAIVCLGLPSAAQVGGDPQDAPVFARTPELAAAPATPACNRLRELAPGIDRLEHSPDSDNSIWAYVRMLKEGEGGMCESVDDARRQRSTTAFAAARQYDDVDGWTASINLCFVEICDRLRQTKSALAPERQRRNPAGAPMQPQSQSLASSNPFRANNGAAGALPENPFRPREKDRNSQRPRLKAGPHQKLGSVEYWLSEGDPVSGASTIYVRNLGPKLLDLRVKVTDCFRVSAASCGTDNHALRPGELWGAGVNCFPIDQPCSFNYVVSYTER